MPSPIPSRQPSQPLYIFFNFGAKKRSRANTQRFRCVLYEKETKLLLDSRSHKIYSKFTPEGIGTKEVEGAFEERFAPSYLRSDKYKEYQKEYRESHTDTTNAERQRKYRRTKKAEESQNS